MQRIQRVAASTSQRRTRFVLERKCTKKRNDRESEENEKNVRKIRARPPVQLASLTDVEDLAQRTVVGSCTHVHDRYHEWRRYGTVDSEARLVAEALLRWYQRVQRSLPWRVPSNGKPREWKSPVESTADQRAYEVWVSEIMLSQTRVATVIRYWLTWMSKWPTIKHLAEADMEEVYKVWSGLGYYTRARRLHEAAGTVVKDFGGKLPESPEELEKSIPGVGRYTAGAVSSIAYNKVTPVVDGNVVRVLTRLLAIGGDTKSSSVNERLWVLAAELVENADPQFPGDHNQAMMELGALVCTPTGPKCEECPVNRWCRSFAEQNAYTALREKGSPLSSSLPPSRSQGSVCDVCEPVDVRNDGKDNPFSVTRFPRKTMKKAKREEDCTICIYERIARDDPTSGEYLLTKRPKDGLLAGLWDFPSTTLLSAPDGKTPNDDPSLLTSHLFRIGAVDADDVVESKTEEVGEFIHVFSHVRMTYRVLKVTMMTTTAKGSVGKVDEKVWRWIPFESVECQGIPTTARKALKMMVPRIPVPLQ